MSLPQRPQKFKSGPRFSRRLGSSPTHKRSHYSPQRKLEVAQVRKAGACSDCRRRKVRCKHALQTVASNPNSPKSPSLEEGINSLFRGDSDVVPGLASSCPESTGTQYSDCPRTTRPTYSLSTTTPPSHIGMSPDAYWSTPTPHDDDPSTNSIQNTFPAEDDTCSVFLTEELTPVLSYTLSSGSYQATKYESKQTPQTPEALSHFDTMSNMWFPSKNVSAYEWETNFPLTTHAYDVERGYGSFEVPKAEVPDVQHSTLTYSGFATFQKANYKPQGFCDIHYSAETCEDSHFWGAHCHHSYSVYPDLP